MAHFRRDSNGEAFADLTADPGSNLDIAKLTDYENKTRSNPKLLF